MKALHAYGDFTVKEIDLPEPNLPEYGVLVKPLLVGICRSDIAQFAGLEKGVPPGMFGHEGLGVVVESNMPATKIGSIVSTYSDPAYADLYPARYDEFVQVPEVHQKYILQPTACALNIYQEHVRFTKFMKLDYEPVLMLGSGFMATTIAEAFRQYHPGLELVVVGRANQEFFNAHDIEIVPDVDNLQSRFGEFGSVIDISSKAENFYRIARDILPNGGLVNYAGTPSEDVKTNFFEACWKTLTFIMPSPRSKNFHGAMVLARDMIQEGKLDTDALWTESYDRSNLNDVQRGFGIGYNRPPGYIRGWIDYRN